MTRNSKGQFMKKSTRSDSAVADQTSIVMFGLLFVVVTFAQTYVM